MSRILPGGWHCLVVLNSLVFTVLNGLVLAMYEFVLALGLCVE
jgi:hypothetical protein